MLLFLDVDGTLIPFGAAGSYPAYEAGGRSSAHATGNPLLTRIDPGLGPRLAALGCELVWATTWMDEANDCVASWLGLPPLPVVDWPDEQCPPGPLHWKTRPLVARAGGRPFIWLDDEITDADRTWVTAHHPERALLHRVDHRYGLTDADFAVLEGWIGGLGPT
ncbi:HAD domain-containing protein [Streptomyces sp. NPDC002088]|uniref:HAD domain-containing protein n=1 Tax=Streptomyces sp. NPDC002088 TaxID=3154665 RepID=UPI00331D74E6